MPPSLALFFALLSLALALLGGNSGSDEVLAAPELVERCEPTFSALAFFSPLSQRVLRGFTDRPFGLAARRAVDGAG